MHTVIRGPAAHVNAATHSDDRAEALVEKWTEHSLTEVELLGGQTVLSFEEAARALKMPVEVSCGVVQCLFFFADGSSYFDERAMQFGVGDLVRLVRAMPGWLRE